jgi:hypothetical protein
MFNANDRKELANTYNDSFVMYNDTLAETVLNMLIKKKFTEEQVAMLSGR